jgi:hypothetical protein
MQRRGGVEHAHHARPDAHRAHVFGVPGGLPVQRVQVLQDRQHAVAPAPFTQQLRQVVGRQVRLSK